MSPSRAVTLAGRVVSGWTALYTRGLPPLARDTRREELDSDVWEHVRAARSEGDPTSLVALEMLERMLAGIPSDLSWRRMHLSAAGRAVTDGKDHRMLERFKKGWWLALAALLTAWNLFLVPSYWTADDVGMILVAIPSAAVLLLVGGMASRERSRVGGDVAIAVGAILGYVSAWWLPPVILISLAIVVGALADAGRARRRSAAVV